MLLSCRLTIRRIIFLVFLLAFIQPGNAQKAPVDVPTAFNAISNKPTVFHLKNGGIKVPAGGHLQGIQSIHGNDLLISASSGSYSYYLTGQLDWQTGKGQITSLNKIEASPYRHAGGCQAHGNELAVGIEDNQAKDKSKIVVITLDDSLREVRKRVVAQRQGIIKRSTAGAVGFMKENLGRYWIVVGDWDSRNIDFYLSKIGSDTLFDLYTTYHFPDGENLCSYQSINLLTDSDGKVFMIGFGHNGVKNRADLYAVMGKNEAAYLRPITTRYFKCKAGAGFRYASGIYITPQGQLTIYTCGRNLNAKTPLNIFK